MNTRRIRSEEPVPGRCARGSPGSCDEVKAIVDPYVGGVATTKSLGAPLEGVSCEFANATASTIVVLNMGLATPDESAMPVGLDSVRSRSWPERSSGRSGPSGSCKHSGRGLFLAVIVVVVAAFLGVLVSGGSRAESA